MKVKTLLAGMAVAALATSCAPTNKTTVANSQARVAQANAEIIVVNPTAKVDVNPTRFSDEFRYQSSELKNFFDSYNRIDEDKLRTDAASKFLKKHNGDILVAPLFNTEKNYSNNKIDNCTITINGYVGNFVDWDKNGIEEVTTENGEATEKARVSVFTLQ